MSKSRDIADSAATINYIDGLTSDAQSQLDGKATLDASPTFTGTVTATAFSGDGSGLTGVDSLPSQTGNAGSFLTTDGTDASWAEVSASPTLEATASGSLANGDMVIVNADGTVSVVAEAIGPSVVGSPTVYNSALSRYNNITYDSSNNKVVIIYRDGDSTAYGMAIVGTVSGSSISFGTPVVFESSSVSMETGAVTFDSSNNKVVVAFRRISDQKGYARVLTISGTSISVGADTQFVNALPTNVSTIFDSNSNKVVIFFSNNSSSSYGTYVVGTVSGTSINFGSANIFNAANTRELAATFDSFNNKVIVVYRDNGNSEYGTALVGDVSGTSIGFASSVVFNTGTSNDMSATFDSFNNKVVISYSDEPDGYKGKCIVGTVSGLSISFGSPVVFETNSAYHQTAITFDSVNNKIILAWRQDISAVYKSFVAVGTVSGTSISFDTPIIFVNGYTQNSTITYDSNAQAAVLVYMDVTNSNYGTATVIQAVTTSTNLTTENFIGVSDAAYSDGSTAKIQLVGSVDDAQSGLTAGQTYYVQGDNTLSETPANPSVVAGTAVSATKLIVKG